MVVGTQDDLKHFLGEQAEIAFSFIEKAKDIECPVGVWNELADGLRAIVLEKSGFRKDIFECHHVYRDLHLVLQGQDNMLLAGNPIAVVQEYIPADDYELCEASVAAETALFPNALAVLDPHEWHTNRIDDVVTRKIVFKQKRSA